MPRDLVRGLWALRAWQPRAMFVRWRSQTSESGSAAHSSDSLNFHRAHQFARKFEGKRCDSSPVQVRRRSTEVAAAIGDFGGRGGT